MSDRDLAPERVAELVGSGQAQLIDVRTDQERAEARIAGSAHIPLDQLSTRASEVEPGRPAVFVCRVGERSAMAADAFAASGLEAYNLAGGIEAWKRAGRPVER